MDGLTSKVGTGPQDKVAEDNGRSLKDDASLGWIIVVIGQQVEASVPGWQDEVCYGIIRQNIFKKGQGAWKVPSYMPIRVNWVVDNLTLGVKLDRFSH